MAEINQTLTQLKLEPANTKNLKSFVGELNGNLKILEKGFGVKIFQNGNKVSISGKEEDIKKASNAIQDLYATTTQGPQTPPKCSSPLPSRGPWCAPCAGREARESESG